MRQMRERPVEIWRKDFPIASREDHYITRLEFTKFLVMASGAAFLGNAYFLVRKREARLAAGKDMVICSTSELSPGKVKLFRYPTKDDPAMLIQLKSGEYVAYTQRCTHLSCPVMFSPASDKLVCPCHNGSFDAATGAVLAGPPPRPLPRITLAVRGDQIIATGVQAS